MAVVAVLLGSNINPQVNIPRAVRLLRRLFDVTAVSTAWQTAAVGSDGPDFINVAVLMQTDAQAEQLKAACLRQVENRMGRVRKADKNAPRTIDLDVVVYNDQVLDEGLWTFPHIAIPVGELLPDLLDPLSGSLLRQKRAEMLRAAQAQPREDFQFL